ncbi:MAG: MFS transporter, partial [Methanobacterium sp.]|nr:MFS transporter [Methanobacterium sp.]
MEMNSQATWLTLIIMAVASFITTFDTTFMNVAIINLVQDLNTTVGTVQTIITIYALTMGCLMLFGAKIQDIIGRKKTFIIGSVLYGVGALIATFSLN